ncbi:MAG: PEP-CTERM sorting domain-containing protein [Gammaproteobacteria bacterium]|nr:PEP-CTERM sorting domain-containing protein [Gammaproteobacteria bacterium]
MSINRSIKALAVLSSLLFSTVINASLVTFDVYAKANSSSSNNGVNTGLSFNSGDLINGSVDPNDLWNAGPLPRWSNADGLITNVYATGSDDSGETAGTQIGMLFGNMTQSGLSAPYGSLVGEINNIFFVLGTSFNVAAPDSGVLSLYYWDSNAYDNAEFISVSIDNGLSAVPVPAAIWLLSSGLIGLIGMGRKPSKRGSTSVK